MSPDTSLNIVPPPSWTSRKTFEWSSAEDRQYPRHPSGGYMVLQRR